MTELSSINTARWLRETGLKERAGEVFPMVVLWSRVCLFILICAERVGKSFVFLHTTGGWDSSTNLEGGPPLIPFDMFYFLFLFFSFFSPFLSSSFFFFLFSFFVPCFPFFPFVFSFFFFFSFFLFFSLFFFLCFSFFLCLHPFSFFFSSFSPNFACEWGSYLCLENCPWIQDFSSPSPPGCLSFFMLSLLCFSCCAIHSMLSMLCYLSCAIYAIYAVLSSPYYLCCVSLLRGRCYAIFPMLSLLCYLCSTIFAHRSSLSLIFYLCSAVFAIFALLSLLCVFAMRSSLINPGFHGYLC